MLQHIRLNYRETRECLGEAQHQQPKCKNNEPALSLSLSSSIFAFCVFVCVCAFVYWLCVIESTNFATTSFENGTVTMCGACEFMLCPRAFMLLFGHFAYTILLIGCGECAIVSPKIFFAAVFAFLLLWQPSSFCLIMCFIAAIILCLFAVCGYILVFSYTQHTLCLLMYGYVDIVCV